MLTFALSFSCEILEEFLLPGLISKVFGKSVRFVWALKILLHNISVSLTSSKRKKIEIETKSDKEEPF